MVFEEAARDPQIAARADEILKRQEGAGAATAVFEPVPIFDAEKQFVDVSEGSGHEYQAPGPDDIRGPCPGLNAFANHGFLPRNGYATISQFVDVTTQVVAIGGTPPASIGSGNGLSGSHNKYESDASPTRPDLYQSGNNYKTQADQFQQMIDASPGGFVTMESLTSFRAQRFNTQKETNPYFFNGPFTGVLVQPAAYTFIYRFMANHSEEAPAGELSYDVIKSWFAIDGESGSYTANQGHERIPENWYKRAIAYPYELDYFNADVLNAAALHPEFLDVGGNLGTTDSFTGVDITDLTGGIFNAADLLKGNNLGCFAYQLSTTAKPDLLLGLLDPVTDLVGDVVSQLSCPKLNQVDEDLLKQFPGYRQ
ncbi:hypothetical protein BTJ68_12763 [Hortaea werneckii EXF-2000]|uniref:Heme haloperoxidase family profile domain-containing protein n=1 Tax=Hortaea werneckii EXF-2000 TaxID=1157616 RepID=A0A1Z5SPA3_HORWE|nr:hypothetical protein BTJ68_12763 [Hortaea werneckii EXF-2000]